MKRKESTPAIKDAALILPGVDYPFFSLLAQYVLPDAAVRHRYSA